jgi:predicted nucleic acid-binding Zn ribbon protein
MHAPISKCQNCGKPIEQGPKRYCSDSCLLTHRERIRSKAGLSGTEKTSCSPPIGPCFTCGRSFVQTESRFCSERCRDSFDAGAPPYSPPPSAKEILEPFPVSPLILGQGPKGAIIECSGCRKPFDSIGLRYCSKECRDRDYEKAEIAAAKGPFEFDDRRRVCEAEGCTERILLFRKGRAVSKATRFCSPKCARKARNGPGAHPGENGRRNDKKAPDFIGPFEGSPKVPPQEGEP